MEIKLYLICHVNSQNHLTEGLFGFMDGSPVQYVTTQTSLVNIDIMIV